MNHSEHAQKDTKVVVVANQKGGVGKSTNAINLAASLGELGKLSLVVDLDATAGATKALRAPTSGWLTSFELITRSEEPAACVIDESEEEVALPKGVHLIPASRDLLKLDQWVGSHERRWDNPLEILLAPLDALRGRYDFIFLDTPPQVTVTSLPAFRAADFVILSSVPEKLSVDGLVDALGDIKGARRKGNPGLQLLGVVVCSYPKNLTRLARELLRKIEGNIVHETTGEPLKFKTDIHRKIVIQEAQRVGQSVLEYAPTDPSADEYRELAREFLDRVQRFAEPAYELPRPGAAVRQADQSRPGEVANA